MVKKYPAAGNLNEIGQVAQKTLDFLEKYVPNLLTLFHKASGKLNLLPGYFFEQAKLIFCPL